MSVVYRKMLLTVPVLFLEPVFAGDGFTALQSDSEQFVLSTCRAFNGNPDGELETDLFTVCGSMVNNSDSDIGRQLDDTALGGGYQNAVSEENFSSVSISADAALTSMANLSAHVAKLRKAGQAVAYNGSEPYYAWSGEQGGAAGDTGGLLDNQLSFFINGRGGFGQTKQTGRENASDFNSGGIVAGLDYRISDNFLLGASAGYSHFNLDFTQSIDVAGGSVKADQYDIATFASFFVKDFYVDALFSYGWADYKLNRNVFIDSNNSRVDRVLRRAQATPNGNQLAASLATGYDFHYQGLSYGPYVQLAYFNASIDQYQEAGADGLDLLVGRQSIDSLESIFGAHVAYAINLASAVVIPQFRFDWHHEFFDGARAFDVKYVNAASTDTTTMRLFSNGPDSDYFNLGVGVAANFKGGVQGFINYETVLALRTIDSHVFSAGLRYEF